MEPDGPKPERPAPEHRRTGTEVGDRVRVWWSPTTHRTKTDYSGMYWPGRVLARSDGKVEVQYDNGDTEMVDEESVSPNPQLVGFGAEEHPLQVGEFVEVFNNSSADPAEWLARVVKVNKKSVVVGYPFHDADNETVSDTLIRRARIWDARARSWINIKPFQNWEDGEVSAPVELESCNDQELFHLLAKHTSRKKRPAPAEDKDKAASAAAKVQDRNITLPGGAGQSTAVPDSSVPGSSLSSLLTNTAIASLPQTTGNGEGGRKQKKKDPNAPKVALSAYGHFLNHHRPLVKERLGPNASNNDVTLKVADYWRAATAAEKLPFHQAAEADKARFERESAAFAVNFEDEEDVRKKKAKKDPNAPKRPRSAYILFSMDFRKGLQSEVDFNEATKLAAASWKRSDQATTAKYQAQADLERQAYAQAHKIYLANRQKAEREEAAARAAAAAAVALQYEQEKAADAGYRKQGGVQNQTCPPQQQQQQQQGGGAAIQGVHAIKPRSMRPVYLLPYDAPQHHPSPLWPPATPLRQPARLPTFAANDPRGHGNQTMRVADPAPRYPDPNVAGPSGPVPQQHQQAAAEPYNYAQPSEYAQPSYWPAPIYAGYSQGVDEPVQLQQLRPHQRAALAAATGAVPSSMPPLPMSSIMAALESLDLERVKMAFSKLRINDQAYYMLCDVWRASSPKVHDAVRAFKQHVENRPNKPDWKGFLIGIFGLQAINPHLPNNMRWGCKYIDRLGRQVEMQQMQQMQQQPRA